LTTRSKNKTKIINLITINGARITSSRSHHSFQQAPGNNFLPPIPHSISQINDLLTTPSNNKIKSTDSNIDYKEDKTINEPLIIFRFGFLLLRQVILLRLIAYRHRRSNPEFRELGFCGTQTQSERSTT